MKAAASHAASDVERCGGSSISERALASSASTRSARVICGAISPVSSVAVSSVAVSSVAISVAISVMISVRDERSEPTTVCVAESRSGS